MFEEITFNFYRFKGHKLTLYNLSHSLSEEMDIKWM